MTKHTTMIFNLREFSDRELDRLSERAESVHFTNLQSDLKVVTAKMHIFQEGLQRMVAIGDDNVGEVALQFLREGLNYGDSF